MWDIENVGEMNSTFPSSIFRSLEDVGKSEKTLYDALVLDAIDFD